MKEHLLITRAYCSHEDMDGDYFIEYITQKDIDIIKSYRNTLNNLDKECSSVCFRYYGFKLIDYPDWDDDDIILFDQWDDNEKNGFILIKNPKLIKKIETINQHYIDICEVRFLPRWKNEFEYSCYLKNTAIRFTSPLISILKLEEILK